MGSGGRCVAGCCEESGSVSELAARGGVSLGAQLSTTSVPRIDQVLDLNCIPATTGRRRRGTAVE